MNARTQAPMRRLTDFRPVHAVVGLIENMPFPSHAELDSIVAALKARIQQAPRLRYAALALADVQDAIDDAEPAPAEALDLSCDGCAGSGVNRHNGSGCIACHGRGVTA
jgi:hypothetical protein